MSFKSTKLTSLFSNFKVYLCKIFTLKLSAYFCVINSIKIPQTFEKLWNIFGIYSKIVWILGIFVEYLWNLFHKNGHCWSYFHLPQFPKFFHLPIYLLFAKFSYLFVFRFIYLCFYYLRNYKIWRFSLFTQRHTRFALD